MRLGSEDERLLEATPRVVARLPVLAAARRPFLASRHRLHSHHERAADHELGAAGAYDYPSEVTTLVAKMATVSTQTQIDEVTFFDGKLNIALGILVTMMPGYGQSVDEMLWHSFGETSAVHVSGVTVWKNKLLNSRIRPTTVIQEL